MALFSAGAVYWECWWLSPAGRLPFDVPEFELASALFDVKAARSKSCWLADKYGLNWVSVTAVCLAIEEFVGRAR